MYKKVGFQRIGEYMWPLPVTVMMMDHKTDYEKKKFCDIFVSRINNGLFFLDPGRGEEG